MSSPLLDKSLDFATQIVLFYEEFSRKQFPKQLKQGPIYGII